MSDHNDMKLEINRRKLGKFNNTQKLNNLLLNNQWVKEVIKMEIKKYLETNNNGNGTQQHQGDAVKWFKGEFIAMNAYVKKEERP